MRYYQLREKGWGWVGEEREDEVPHQGIARS
jgi:hypothetical protein